MGLCTVLPLIAALGFAAGAGSTPVVNSTSDAATNSTPNSSDASPSSVQCVVLEVGADGAPEQVSCNGALLLKPESVPVGSRSWFQALFCALICVVGAAHAAGLTLGLTSFDEFGLKVLCNLDSNDVAPQEDRATRKLAQQRLKRDQQYAQAILPLISGDFAVCKGKPSMNPSNGHYLLVTLLLANAAANEALPLFLDKLVPSWLAIILSVTVVLIFGEIVPSAIFTGPSQLRLAAAFAPVVKVARILFFPVVYPISLLLDVCLEHEEADHGRGEMKATAKTLLSAGLEPEEVNMIHGVLDMHQRTASDIAQPLVDAKMVAHDEIITRELVRKVLGWGHSRVFIYKPNPADPQDRSDIAGVLLVKKLLGVNFEEGCSIADVKHAWTEPKMLEADDNLLTVLNKFQDGSCHLALVRESPRADNPRAESETESESDGDEDGLVPAAESDAKPMMFCSLEDVIESMLKADIYDEDDLELGRDFPKQIVYANQRSSLLRAGSSGILATSSAQRERRAFFRRRQSTKMASP